MEILNYHQRIIHPQELSPVISMPGIQEIISSGDNLIEYDQDEYASQVKITNGRPWFLYKLRDRRDDGERWQPSPLVGWHYNLDSDVFPHGPSVEESTYFLDPRYPLHELYEPETASFIENPFEQLPYENPSQENMDKWFETWQKVVSDTSTPYPGYYATKNIPGTYKHVHSQTLPMLKDKGYEYLTAVPTWFHVAKMYEHMGFMYVDEQDQAKIDELSARLPYRNQRERVEASWVVMLQFWAKLAEDIGYPLERANGVVLRDNNDEILQFPLNLDHNLWMAKKL